MSIPASYKNIFHRTTMLDRRIAEYCIKNKEKLAVPQKLAEKLKDEFYKSKDNILVFEQTTYGIGDIDNEWYIAYNAPEEIYLFEMTVELLEETNYGTANR
jgi:hypothetical protein